MSNKQTNYTKEWIDTIQLMDCVEGMKKLDDNSVDLIIADPPYNLSKGNSWNWDQSVKLNGFGGKWSKTMEDWDNMTFQGYWHFTDAWIKEAKRVLKPSGSIWIYGTYHNIGVINVILQTNKIEIINEIIWYKRNAFPNLSGRRFTASHENLLWAHTGKKRVYTFNYEELKKKKFPNDSLKKDGKQMRTVWDIPNNKKKEELKFGKHPTQKPMSVTERLVLAASNPEDIILVPFCGAGTECVVAKRLGRQFIAFEIEQEYIDIAKQRIDYEKNRLRLF